MRLVILGATSAIAEATARLYAAEGAAILLVGRNDQRLSAMANDLRERGARLAETTVCDLVSEPDVMARLEEFAALAGGIDHFLIAYGVMGLQGEAEKDPAAADAVLRVNFNSVAAWSLAAAAYFERERRGTLLVIGSVAGDRGRRANYVYGAAKAGVAAFVEGIAHRFADTGPRALLIKPGPTDTPMTRGMAGRGMLWSSPEQIAAIIYRQARKARGPVVYAPWFWRYVMLIIRNLPVRVFNRMDI
ncbi:SDR family NAD(P)-dependent oxidoreductase [Breoghania sp. JC706]|uniref:SDR family NAD(P)-dependent oxidoreductase n=1 Tax=Breoghania sp. JC706 TaxID=3117732 RepID=UPI00300A4BD8